MKFHQVLHDFRLLGSHLLVELELLLIGRSSVKVAFGSSLGILLQVSLGNGLPLQHINVIFADGRQSGLPLRNALVVANRFAILGVQFIDQSFLFLGRPVEVVHNTDIVLHLCSCGCGALLALLHRLVQSLGNLCGLFSIFVELLDAFIQGDNQGNHRTDTKCGKGELQCGGRSRGTRQGYRFHAHGGGVGTGCYRSSFSGRRTCSLSDSILRRGSRLSLLRCGLGSRRGGECGFLQSQQFQDGMVGTISTGAVGGELGAHLLDAVHQRHDAHQLLGSLGGILVLHAEGTHRTFKSLPASHCSLDDTDALGEALRIVGVVLDGVLGILHGILQDTGTLGDFQERLTGRVNAISQHLRHLHGEFLQLGTQRLPGNGIVAHVALKLTHIGGHVLEVGIQSLYLLLQSLTVGTVLLLLVELLLRHLHALQLQRQSLIRAFGSLHHLGLVVEDFLQLGLGGLELQFTAGVFLSRDTATFIRILQVLQFLVVPRHQRHILLMRAEDVLGDVEASLLLGVCLTLRLVQLLLLSKLAGDGVGGVGDDLLLLLLDLRQLLGGLRSVFHLRVIHLGNLVEVTLHLNGDFQALGELFPHFGVFVQRVLHRLVECCQLVKRFLGDKVGNQCFVCHISIAL